jgi:hypothetical protein
VDVVDLDQPIVLRSSAPTALAGPRQLLGYPNWKRAAMFYVGSELLSGMLRSTLIATSTTQIKGGRSLHLS